MHAGKGYPRQTINLVWAAENLVSPGPTRRMKLLGLTGVHSGTVAALWQGTTTVSTIAARWSSPLWTIFSFENASDPLATMDVRMTLEEKPSPPGIGWCYWFKTIYEPYYNGVLLARNTTFVDPDFLFIGPHSLSQVGPGWADKTSVPQWNQGSFRVGAANWADQPDYHPYRH